jgi:ABC-2 type transport system permease protein
MIYFPVMVVLGNLNESEILRGLGIQLLWILTFGFVYKYMWSQAMRKYSGVGD